MSADRVTLFGELTALAAAVAFSPFSVIPAVCANCIYCNNSHSTSSGVLSVRSPRQLGCRNRSSEVRSL